MNQDEKTITLTWSKKEIQLIVHCLSICFPKPVISMSSIEKCYGCPTCGVVLEHGVQHCSECGQSLSWEDCLELTGLAERCQ